MLQINASGTWHATAYHDPVGDTENCTTSGKARSGIMIKTYINPLTKDCNEVSGCNFRYRDRLAQEFTEIPIVHPPARTLNSTTGKPYFEDITTALDEEECSCTRDFLAEIVGAGIGPGANCQHCCSCDVSESSNKMVVEGKNANQRASLSGFALVGIVISLVVIVVGMLMVQRKKASNDEEREGNLADPTSPNVPNFTATNASCIETKSLALESSKVEVHVKGWWRTAVPGVLKAPSAKRRVWPGYVVDSGDMDVNHQVNDADDKSVNPERTSCRSITIAVSLSTSVGEFRTRIASEIGVPVKAQRLFFKGYTDSPTDTLTFSELLVSSNVGSQFVAELLDLRYLGQVLHGRLPPGVDIEQIMDDENDDCIIVKHREGCPAIGCTSTACLKAGAALYLEPSSDAGDHVKPRKYQGLFTKLIFVYKYGSEALGIESISDRPPNIVTNSCVRTNGDACLNPAHIIAKVRFTKPPKRGGSVHFEKQKQAQKRRRSKNIPNGKNHMAAVTTATAASRTVKGIAGNLGAGSEMIERELGLVFLEVDELSVPSHDIKVEPAIDLDGSRALELLEAAEATLSEIHGDRQLLCISSNISAGILRGEHFTDLTAVSDIPSNRVKTINSAVDDGFYGSNNSSEFGSSPSIVSDFDYVETVI